MEEDLDFIEYFAGAEAWGKGMRSRGWHGLSIDIKQNNDLHNIMTVRGFIAALVWTMRLKSELAIQHMGIVCSSWVWMSRASTGRSSSDPMGDNSSAVVRHANCMVARCCIIIYLAAARLVTTMVEQPASSLMEKHDRMQTLMSKLSWRKVRTYMGSFGGETMKATMMYGGMKWLTQLAREMPSKDFTAAKTLVARNEHGQVTGANSIQKGLGKQSPTCTRGPGRKKHPHNDTNPLGELTVFPEKDPDNHDTWPDAELDEVADYCQLPVSHMPWE